jgi:hypothetical protein
VDRARPEGSACGCGAAIETGGSHTASSGSRARASEAQGVVGRTGFEPVKASATRFTVWPLWPLGYLPGSNPALGNARDPMCGANAARALRALRARGRAAPVHLGSCLVATERGSRAPAPRNSWARRRSLSGWSQRWDSNPQPPDYKSGAQPVELRWRGSSADAQRARGAARHRPSQNSKSKEQRLAARMPSGARGGHGTHPGPRRKHSFPDPGPFDCAPALPSRGGARIWARAAPERRSMI